MSTGRGFWDVMNDHFFEISVITILGMWSARTMWSVWCVTRSTENIARAKLEKNNKDVDVDSDE